MNRNINHEVPVFADTRPAVQRTAALKAGRDAAEKIHPGGGRSVSGYTAKAEAAFWKAFSATQKAQGR